MEWFNDLPPVLRNAAQTGFIVAGAAVFIVTYIRSMMRPPAPPLGFDLSRMEGNQKDALGKLDDLTGAVNQLAQITASGFAQAHSDRMAILQRLHDVFARLDRGR